MYFVLYIVLLAVIFIVWLSLSRWYSRIMNRLKVEKGYTDELYLFALSFWLGFFGWIISALIVISLPDFRFNERLEKEKEKKEQGK